MSGSTRGCVT